MQNNCRLLARRILPAAAALGLMFAAGCASPLANLTPSALPANPSQLYTISIRYTPNAAQLVPGSVVVNLVIDQQPHPMKKSAIGTDIYLLDYQVPAGATDLAYYVLASYDSVSSRGKVGHHDDRTELLHSKISGRYVLSLATNRGPVGARIGIVGAGFTAQDKVSLEGTPALTVFESPNALGFYVPAVAAGRSYKVQISNAAATVVAGTFGVDASNVTVSPDSLRLRAGETQTLTFTVPTTATAGGLLLDVTTDVPDSVIMPEVMVPAGYTSVTVNVTGGRPGSGTLTLHGYGTGDVIVPVTVTP